MVIEFSVDYLKRFFDCDIDNRFPENSLMDDPKMRGLQVFLDKGEKVIPPELRFISNDLCQVVDGQHRFGMARFKKMKWIPFLVLKSQIKTIKTLSSDHYKIIES